MKYSPMNLCLFDAQPEATKLWQELASLRSLQINVFPAWHGVTGVPVNTHLLIVDQSAMGEAFEEQLLQTCREHPQMLVVATGTQLSVQAVVELMRGGVSHLIEKPFPRELLSQAFPKLFAASQALQASKAEFIKLSQLFASLTTRERSVLDCVLAGVSNKDTAKQLQVSIRTVESRRAKVYRKLELKHVAELVRKMDRLERLHAIFNVKSSLPVKTHLPRFHLQFLSTGMHAPTALVELDASA